MQVSRFNFLVPSPREPRVHFLYNSLHDNRIVIEDGEFNIRSLLAKIRDHGELNQEEIAAAEDLREMGYLLEDGVDEKEIFNQWMKDRVTEQNEILTVTVLTTLACNLRCPYCYEKDKLGKSKMSPATLNRVIRWVKTRIQETHPVKLNVIFFGGEPLINLQAIRGFSREIYPFCQTIGLEYSAGMATNGVFLTRPIAQELRTYGFQWVKITFDGDRCEHDKKRIYSDGRGTFDKIYQNLEDCAGKLKILLGGNFDRENANSFKRLLKRIDGSKFRDDIIATNFKPIMPEMGKRKAKGELDGIAAACERCTYTDYEIQKLLELREETRKYNLKPTDPINTGPCEFYRRNAVTIGIDGKIYKCIAFLGIEGTEIGDVTRQEFNATGEKMLQASKPFENAKCKNCAFPPICGGGCRADAYNTTGSFENISCQQDYFKETLKQELPNEYYEDAKWAEQMGGV